MSSRVTVDDVADVRTGDKGDTAIVAVFPRRPEVYDAVLAAMSEDAVASFLGAGVAGPVRRTPMPGVQGIVFEVPGLLGGGVTGSPVLDGHGKCLSYLIATMPLPGLRHPL